MKKEFLFILYLCLAVSCHDSKVDKLSNLVKEWTGKEIQFPTHSIFTIQGKNTVDFNFSHSAYKIVMYADSVGCFSCKMQLHKWKKFMLEIDSLQVKDLDVSFVFYLYPKSMKKLHKLLKYEHFVYPVCLDEQDEFNKLNHFPSEIAFQTFLLNQDNKVMAIGNPALNPKVKELYLKLLRGDTLSREKPILTEAKLSLDYLDLGRFYKSKKHILKLKNTGSKPLIIQGVSTSCGCTKVEFDKKPISVGSEAELIIIYEAESSGRFRKNVDIYCNIASSPLRVVVTGEVRE
ncbi:DUF1573 domain-containing protein [Bacteroides thetaiotaomicron]|uniref:DUF1573 domain-containing protein n=1 Tax=Bacteroides thetaiotaomicron TaxID=818 RepID=UPI0039B5B909